MAKPEVVTCPPRVMEKIVMVDRVEAGLELVTFHRLTQQHY